MRTPAVARRRWAVLGVTGLALAVLGGGLAACGDDDDPEAGEATPTPGATPTGPGADQGQVADCLVGDWRSVEVTGEIGGDVARVALSGGGGVTLRVQPDGATIVNFTGMQPVSLSGEVLGAQVAGEAAYSGPAQATMRSEPGTAGGWEPVDEVDWSQVRLTIDLTEPIEGRPLDEVPLGEAVEQADEITGEVIDVDPLLADGSFECQNDSLLLSPTDDTTGMTWTMTRA